MKSRIAKAALIVALFVSLPIFFAVKGRLHEPRLDAIWITLPYSFPSSIDRETYEWATTNQILCMEPQSTQSKCIAYSPFEGKEHQMVWLSTLLDNTFPNGRVAMAVFPPYILAYNIVEGGAEAKAVLSRIDSTHSAVFSVPSMRCLGFWSTTNIGWLAKVYGQNSGQWKFVEYTNNAIQTSDAARPEGQWLGFGSDGKFLSLSPRESAVSYPKGITSAVILRFDLRRGTNAVSASSITFPRPASIYGYISPKGDKILWLLLHASKPLSIMKHFPFVSQESFDDSEIWISDDFGRGVREIGKFSPHENVVPKWLPDESRFSLIVSNRLRLIFDGQSL